MPGKSNPTTGDSRVNIVFILTDDQGYWALGAAGNPEIQTPNLDRLARTGIRFENFFCTSPVCSPARASILTGRIPSQHGIHDWLRAGNALLEHESEAGVTAQVLVAEGELIQYLEGQPGYTDHLAQAGYTCGLSGKWHLGDSHHPQKGFSYWEAHALGGGPYYNAPIIRAGKVVSEPSYITDYITENALRFMDQQIGAPQPFYLSVHYTAPHSPWDREHHPHDLYDEYFTHCDFASIPLEPMHQQQVNSAPYGYTLETRRPLLSGYFAAITALDRGVGRILDWLEAHNLRENTLVLFSSDNGMNMGQHGIFGKGNGTFPLNLFDTSVKVPMIISRPSHVPQGQAEYCPKVNTDLLSHYDLFPTLLAYLGLPNPQADGLPGKSFASLLTGASPSGNEMDTRILAGAIHDEYGPTRMLRTQEWKYIHRYPNGPHEFFNLVDDPEERRNLIGESEHARRIQDFKVEMEAWFVRYTDPCFDGVREPVTGKGQLTWAGSAGKGRKAFADDWEYIRNS